ncbi:MAG TPA: hypothetical protein DCM14_04080, partial [Clostridiales bacterium UBA8153]|nr:hypothetical protein [Clostridiales bacterium UBA8153]
RLCGPLADRELAGAMVRVVSQQLALRRRRLQQGWVVCRTCRTLAPPRPGGTCGLCLDGEGRRRLDKARLLLSQVPWCALDRVQQEVPGLTAAEYRQVKEALAAQWESAYTRSVGNDARLAGQSASLLAMLHSGRPPGQGDPAGPLSQLPGSQAIPGPREKRRHRKK